MNSITGFTSMARSNNHHEVKSLAELGRRETRNMFKGLRPLGELEKPRRRYHNIVYVIVSVFTAALYTQDR
jgi:hypothetical protein